MKKITLFLFVALASFALEAQDTKPAASPSSELKQTIGLTDVTVEYSRPSMKNRTIFGDLVPYDKIWRTGANARTKITFSKDVTFEGTDVKAGSYAIFTKPNATSWDVYLYTDTEGGGTPKEWDESKVAAKVNVPVVNFPGAMTVETFAISFEDLRDNRGSLGMSWEDVYVSVKIEVGS